MAADEKTSEWLDAPNHHIIDSESGDIPELLQQIPGPPTLLYVLGDKDALHLPALAVVGSRNPTRGGIQNAYDFAYHLGRCGFCIVSGLAQGIDTAAHKGALDAGASTVAFLGHGIDRVYPAENRELAHRIAEQGALCSEYPLGSPPRREHFPQRNRLISGMSVGTLVVEAGLRSGALITARFAAEQGREVFAVPGSIHNPTARGCHRLIRAGAKLVESSHDIIEELPGILASIGESVKQNAAASTANRDRERDPEYQRLLEFMGWDPVTVDTLVKRSGLTADEVSSMLLILELEGNVEPLAGGCYIQREEGPTR